MIRIDFFHPKLQSKVEAEAPSKVPSPRKSPFGFRTAMFSALALIIVILAVFIYFRIGRQPSSVEAPPVGRESPRQVAARPLEEDARKPSREIKEEAPKEIVREITPSVEAPEEIPDVSPSFRYTVQVAAWEDVGDARRMADYFGDNGYDARIETVDVPGRGLYHRVRVGYFVDYSQAQAAGEVLRSKFGCDIWIVGLEED